MRSIVIGVLVLFGFFVFFLVEKLLSVDAGRETGVVDDTTPSSTPAGHQHAHKHANKQLAAAGVLNIVADMMHNFTDGLAIGATYSAGGSLAVATTVSIFVHEIPHELGDFAILLESGYTKFEAIQMQMVTAVAAVLGTVLGLFAQNHPTVECVLLSLTCGGFLFVSTLGVLPMVSAKKSASYTQITFECISFLLGVSLMVLVAFIEEFSEGGHVHESHHHHKHHDEH